MKRIGTILLALTMLLSVAAGAISPVSAAESTEIRPFYGLGWSPIDNTLTPNCDEVVTIGVRPTSDKEVQFYKDDKTLGTDEEKLLNWVKTQMDSRPEGTRFLHIYNTLSIAGMNPKDVIDLSDGFDKMKVLWTDFLQRYKDMGGGVGPGRFWDLLRHKEEKADSEKGYRSPIKNESPADDRQGIFVERKPPEYRGIPGVAIKFPCTW